MILAVQVCGFNCRAIKAPRAADGLAGSRRVVRVWFSTMRDTGSGLWLVGRSGGDAQLDRSPASAVAGSCREPALGVGTLRIDFLVNRAILTPLYSRFVANNRLMDKLQRLRLSLAALMAQLLRQFSPNECATLLRHLADELDSSAACLPTDRGRKSMN